MRKMIKLLLIVLSIFCTGLTFANENDTVVSSENQAPAVARPLNESTVVVADRSPTALQLGLQSAFTDVMVKSSGNPDEMSSPVIQKAANNVTQWVQSYSYVEQPNPASAKSTLTLHVVFDPAGVQKLIRKSARKAGSAKRAKKLNQPLQSNSQPTQVSQLDSPSTVMMLVSGVHSLADYVQVMHAVRDKNDVMRVSVSDMQSDHILLKVKVIGNSTDFQKVLASDTNFKSIADNLQTKQLQYYWMGNQA